VVEKAVRQKEKGLNDGDCHDGPGFQRRKAPVGMIAQERQGTVISGQ
jgi:hypothetical protein